MEDSEIDEKGIYKISFWEFRDCMMAHSCPHCENFKLMNKINEPRIPKPCFVCYEKYIEDIRSK